MHIYLTFSHARIQKWLKYVSVYCNHQLCKNRAVYVFRREVWGFIILF